MATQDVIDKVQKLVTLATDAAASEEEGRNAAMQAARLMTENKLTVIPQSEIDGIKKSVEGFKLQLRKQQQRERGKMILGAIGGALLVKSKVLKF